MRFLIHSLLLFGIILGTLPALADEDEEWCPNEECIDLRVTCEQGNAEGCFALGTLILSLDLSPVDKRELSTDAFARACDEEHLGACLKLAPALRKSDPEEYLALLRRVCEGGEMDGCTSLGAAHEHGIAGLSKNPEQALELYQLACKKGQSRGCRTLARAYLEGVGVAADPSRGRAMLDKLCQDRDVEACYILARRHEKGKDIEENEATADDYYLKACRLGHELSCRKIDPDSCWNFEECKEKCLDDTASACTNLGRAFLSQGSIAPERDVLKARDFLTRGCDLDSAVACFLLADLYEERGPAIGAEPEIFPEITDKSDEKARSLLARGCELDHGPSCESLAFEGFEWDDPAATATEDLLTFEKACALGQVRACRIGAKISKAIHEISGDDAYAAKAAELDAMACLLEPQEDCEASD